MNETIEPIRAASVLMSALSSTLAEFAFIDVEPAGTGDSSSPVKTPVRAAIDVLKPVSCRIEIECPISLRNRIEETLFQGQGEAGDGDDSLLEILNVAAGVFLTSYFGPEVDIKLELPQYLYVSGPDEGAILAEAAGDAEGEPISAVLRSVRYRY